MRTQLSLSLSLLLAALVSADAGAAIARPELVTLFPEPGVWIDPERPETYLTFDMSPTLGWQIRLLEYGDDGRSDWTELHGDRELEFGDPNFSRVPSTYALARGTFSRSSGGSVPFTSTTTNAQLDLTERLSSPDMAFIDRNTAIWDYKNAGGRLLKHRKSEGGVHFQPDTGTLYWMVVRDHLKTQTGVVRIRQFEDTAFYTLDCLDCWREYGLINTDAVAAGTVLQCGTDSCQAFQLDISGLPVSQLSVPYLDRFHSLSLDLDEDRFVEEFWLGPVLPGHFDWKVYETPQVVAPSAPRAPAGVFQGGDLTLAFVPPYALLTGHDEIGQPRWWAATTPLAQAVFLERRGSGRFAMPSSLDAVVPADFTHNVFTSFDGSVLRVRNTAVPGPSTNERTQPMSQVADFDPRPANDIGLLSLRNGESELLGKVRLTREQVLVPNASFERTTLVCLDCVQRGARGQRGRGAFELERLLGRLSWTRGLEAGAPTQIVYRNGTQQFTYGIARDNRFDDQLVLRLVEDANATARNRDVPVEIRFLPVPGLKEGN